MAGLLTQLPDLGELEQLRDLVEHGLDDARQRVSGDPAALIKPLTDALAPVAGQAPDLAGLLAPLAGQRDQLVGALPAGLDQQIAAVLPLLNAADQAVSSSALAPILEDIRAGRSINDIARDGLNVFARQLLDRLPGMAGGRLPAGMQEAVEAFLAAAGGFGGGTPDPAALADFLADHVLGLPLDALEGMAAARAAFFGLIDEMQHTSRGVDAAEQALAAQIGLAAARLETLDPRAAGDWPAALDALQQARAGLAALRGAMQSVPGAIFARLGQIDPARYKAALRQALQALPAAAGAGTAGRFAALSSLADDLLRPLDDLQAMLASTSPARFTSTLRSSLDGMLALFDTMAEAVQDNPVFDLFDDLKQIVDTVANAIQGVRQAIDGAIRAIVGAVDAVLGEFNSIKRQVEAAFAALEVAIARIDVDALAQAVAGLLDQLNSLLAAIPLDDLRTQLDQALSTVERLVTTLSEVAEGALQQVAGLVAALEQIDFAPLAEPVIDAINTIRDTLSAIDPSILPDPLKDLLQEAIDAFERQFDGDFTGFFQREVVDFLNNQLKEASSALTDFVKDLQQKLGEFSSAVGKLDPAALLKPVTDAFKQIDDALADLSGAQLLAPARALLDDALAALRAISPATLLAPLEQAFERDVLAPVQAFRPSTLLQPLIDAFQPLQELIGRLDFSAALSGMAASATEFLGTTHDSLTGALDFAGLPDAGGVAEQVRPVLGLLKPTTSMDEWTAAMEGVLGDYRPSRVLQPIQQALAPVESLLSGAADDLLLATFGRLKALAEVSAIVSAPAAARFAERLEHVATTLESNLPAAVAARLTPGYARAQAALSRIDPAALPANLRAQLDAARATLAVLDPASLAALTAALAPLPGRVRQLAERPLDLSDLAATFGGLLSAATGALPGFLLGELTPESIRAGLAAFSPTALIQRIDERYDAFLDAAERFGPAIQAAVEGFATQLGAKLAALSPAALLERFGELFHPIRDALQAVSPQAIAAALDLAYAGLLDKLAQVHPKVIREPAQALFDTVVGKLEQLQQKVLDTIATAIDQALTRIRATLAALDPQALIISLGNLFELIRHALDGLGLAALLERLATVLAKLGESLTAVLTRAATAFGAMVEALPV